MTPTMFRIAEPYYDHVTAAASRFGISRREVMDRIAIVYRKLPKTKRDEIMLSLAPDCTPAEKRMSARGKIMALANEMAETTAAPMTVVLARLIGWYAGLGSRQQEKLMNLQNPYK